MASFAKKLMKSLSGGSTKNKDKEDDNNVSTNDVNLVLSDEVMLDSVPSPSKKINRRANIADVSVEPESAAPIPKTPKGSKSSKILITALSVNIKYNI